MSRLPLLATAMPITKAKRSWDTDPIDLYVNGRPTRALTVLKATMAPGGVAPTRARLFTANGWTVSNIPDYDVGARLSAAGWIEVRKSGPRGGMRAHISEQGRYVLDVVERLGADYRKELWPAYPGMARKLKDDSGST